MPSLNANTNLESIKIGQKQDKWAYGKINNQHYQLF